MKIYHFALLFLILFIGSIIKTDISVGRLKGMEVEKAEMNNAITRAVDDAVNYLTETGSYGTSTINKDGVITTFFGSLYSSLGLISNKSAQAEIEMYLPVILLCDRDGYYVYYNDEYKSSDGNTYIERIWSEKLPYSYEDDYFIYRFTLTDMVYIYDKNDIFNLERKVINTAYQEFATNPEYTDLKTSYSDCILLNEESYNLVRKGAILNKLEDVMTYYTSKHNHIANQQGVTYTFSLPSGKRDEWAEYIDDVSLLVVFQGYPYGAGKNYTYNKVISAGANIIMKPRYYMEKKSWYYLVHRQGCEMLSKNNALLEETFDSVEECVKKGAYCCECIEYGARVPSLE
jgi:hypothetical protein